MTTTYRCKPFRSIKCGARNPLNGWVVETADDAASLFATRMAREEWGERGRCHHVRREASPEDGRYINYEAFIGHRTSGGMMAGRNVRLAVWVEK